MFDPESKRNGPPPPPQDPGEPAFIGIRARVEQRLVSDIEILHVRREEMTILPIFLPEKASIFRALWEIPISESARTTREKMIAVVEGYWNAAEVGDPLGKVRFHPDCFRSENGMWTTNNPPVFNLSCSEGASRTGPVGNVTNRRYPIVDIERGLVVSLAIFDNPGSDAKTFISTKRGEMPYRFTARTFYFIFELFKIEYERIRAITAIFKPVPYGESMGWDR